MSNFAFVRQTLPTVYEDCARAESYLHSDPRSACFYSRRVVEEIVGYLYDVLSLRIPYKDDLAAKIGDATFRRLVPQGITDKMTRIRKIANTAVHDNRQIRPDVSLAVLRDVFNVVVWASYHHSPYPQAVDLRTQFDPKLAAHAAPLSRDQFAQIAAKFRAQDEARARALAEKTELLAARDAEIAALQAQIAAAQAAAAPDDRDYSESDTRDVFIDLMLHEVGWPLDQDRDREYEVTGMPNAGGKGFVDYVLWGADGRPLAVVEAKRTSKSPEVGQQQAGLYADCLEKQFGRRPVIYYTNGYEHRIWDDAAGYPPREIDGFYTAAELELLIQRRQTRLPLTTAPVNTDIAGRPYQVRAIKAVGDAFDRKQREALLVMATGAGKTRTVIALGRPAAKSQLGQAGAVPGRPHRTGQPGRQCFQGAPARVHHRQPGHREGHRRRVRVHLSDDDEPHRRHGQRPTTFRPRIFRPHRDRRGTPLGVRQVRRDLRLLRLAAGGPDRHPQGRSRPQHLPAVPPRRQVPTDAYSLGKAVDAGYLVPPKGSASAPSSCGPASPTTISPRTRKTSGTPWTGVRTDHPTRWVPKNSTGSCSTRTPSTRCCRR